MVTYFSEMSFDELNKRLVAAREIMKTDQQEAMERALNAVSGFLKGQGIEEDLLRPLDDLWVGFFDLRNGNQSDFFKPNRDVARTMRHDNAANMALASAAITLAPKGQIREEIIARAARKLGVTRSKIMNFRTALKAQRIKSPTALDVYDCWTVPYINDEDKYRHDVSKVLLNIIDK